jgi:hypothetical protein
MNQSQNQPEVQPDQLIKIMQILTLALAGSVAMLGVVLFIAKKPVFDTQIFAENIKNPIHLILFLMGFAILLVRIPATNAVFAAALEKTKPEDLKGVLQIYFAPHILRLALAEAGALMGFMSTMVGGEATPYAVLGAAAFLSIVREMPTKEKIIEKVKTIKPNLMINR